MRASDSEPGTPASAADRDDIRLRPVPQTHELPVSSTGTPVPVQIDEDQEGLVEGFRNMNIKQTHYLGRSSGLVFIRTAIALKDEYSESTRPHAAETQNVPVIHRKHPFKMRDSSFMDDGLVSDCVL